MVSSLHVTIKETLVYIHMNVILLKHTYFHDFQEFKTQKGSYEYMYNQPMHMFKFDR